MRTLQFTWQSDDDEFNSVLNALKRATFEREFFQLKNPVGVAQLLSGNKIRFMRTNEFRLIIAKVKSGRKDAAGSGNLKDFLEIWLTDPTVRTYPSIEVCEKFLD